MKFYPKISVGVYSLVRMERVQTKNRPFTGIRKQIRYNPIIKPYTKARNWSLEHTILPLLMRKIPSSSVLDILIVKALKSYCVSTSMVHIPKAFKAWGKWVFCFKGDKMSGEAFFTHYLKR